MSLLDDKIAEFNNEFKSKVGMKGLTAGNPHYIPFSSPNLNYMLYGGLARGIIAEFYGLESGGKTTTALDACANAQPLFQREYTNELARLNDKLKKTPSKQISQDIENLKQRGPQKVVYFDLEQSLKDKWAKQLGVNIDDLYVVKPEGQCAEELLTMAKELLKTGAVGLMVIDSIPALESSAEQQKDYTEQTMGGGGVPKLLGRFCREVMPYINKYQSTLIFINQVRDSMNMYGDPYSTPGGRAIKFYSSIRLQFQKGSLIDSAGKEIKKGTNSAEGNLVEVIMRKNKVDRPNRELCSYPLSYYKGILRDIDLVDLLVYLGMINQSGSYFTLCDDNGELIEKDGKEVKMQGKDKVVSFISSEPEIRDRYYAMIEPYVKGEK